MQSGDIVNKKSPTVDGDGGYSIYGKYFADENFKYKHNKKYLVGMANMGR